MAATPSTARSAAGAGRPAVELPGDAACWARLPAVASGGGQRLPAWARAVAGRLPRTAAAMLELDWAQRTRSPLPPQLRAKMRWAIARANRCAYGEAHALLDLEKAGGGDAAVRTLTGDPAAWPAGEREALEFARLLTVAAPGIPDELFARLRARHGDAQVAAMVLLAAYGNFQDRIVLGLGLPMEPGGALAPLDVRFAPGALQVTPAAPPPRRAPAELRGAGATVVERDPEWASISYEQLQSRLEQQRRRSPRLPVPAWDELKKRLPPEVAGRPVEVVWNLVCLGYAPELAIPWNTATRTMWAEAQQDRVFEETIFWVQTRAIECNYCMGHCEMLLEVAGLDRQAIAQRTRRLAGDDWSCFPAAEQRAFAFARTLTRAPWALRPEDFRALEEDLGPDRAMATFWWLCRGLYMTRVSDGFQLPLERENVFERFFPRSPALPGAAPAR